MDTQRRTHTEFLIDLEREAALDPARVGNKAATLARLLQAGFPVPHGRVLSTAAFDASTSGDEQPTDAIRHCLDEIIRWAGGAPLAVRSSATSEDLAEASFAGQYETSLGVEGLSELSRAVRACWDSLQTTRVRSYLPGSPPETSSMAVLVQPMVDARAAGVAFTAHPVTGARDQVVIDAVSGLGDRLVGGEATPDRWVISWSGSVEAAGLADAIDADQAIQLAGLARRVEEHLGGPQDIEWAIENGAIQLLQARPITALPDPPVEPIPLEFEVPDGYWEHDASHFPTPTYPIDSIFPSMIENAVRIWVAEFGYLFDGLELREIGGWTYQRLRPIGGKEGPALPAWLMWILVRSIPAMRRRLAVARRAIASDKPGRFIDRWYDTWMPELVDGFRSRHQVDVSSLSDSELEAHIAGATDLAQRGIEIHSLLHGALAPIIFEFTMTCERLLGWDIDQTMEMVRGTSVKSTEPARRLHELAEMARHRPELLETGGATSDQLISRLAAIDTEFSAALAGYIDAYAHRCLGYTLALPTIAENPTLIMAMIRSQIESSYRPSLADEENARARDGAVTRARRALAGQPDGLSEFERALGRAQLAYPVREDNEFYTLSAPFALVRYGVVEMGDRLTQRDVIDRADDVLFLELSEALRALRRPTDHRALVNRRKGERAWALANPGPGSYGKPSSAPTSVEFLPEDARLPMESMIWSLESMMAIAASKTVQVGGRLIEGTAASAGVYSGPVRIVMNESQFPKLRAGDVLVCPVTSPVWSVLFATIGALVTDTGGILSHPAIIAREYRVPAVVATGNATSLLKDGQLVEVDGSSGTVTRLGEGIIP